MADNTTLNPGTGGDLIASDDISGVKFQRNKIVIGADGINGGDIHSGNPFPIYNPPLTITDRSSAITTGGTAQVLAAANATRKGYLIRNNSTGSLYINDITTATVSNSSLEIKPGELFESPVGGTSAAAISIIGATTGQAFTAREW